MKHRRLLVWPLLLLLVALSGCSSSVGSGENKETRVQQARDALAQLYSHTPSAKELSTHAAGILVFPDITKAGFLLGGQFGNGVLFKNGTVAGYYRSTGASYGLQAGLQRFGYALFFMTEDDLDYLSRSGGWEIGVGPSVTVVDEGFARSFSTTSARKGVYAFFFGQRGLMAGLGIQGTKITETK